MNWMITMKDCPEALAEAHNWLYMDKVYAGAVMDKYVRATEPVPIETDCSDLYRTIIIEFFRGSWLSYLRWKIASLGKAHCIPGNDISHMVIKGKPYHSEAVITWFRTGRK